jgi:hypothetical protein
MLQASLVNFHSYLDESFQDKLAKHTYITTHQYTYIIVLLNLRCTLHLVGNPEVWYCIICQMSDRVSAIILEILANTQSCLLPIDRLSVVKDAWISKYIFPFFWQILYLLWDWWGEYWHLIMNDSVYNGLDETMLSSDRRLSTCHKDPVCNRFVVVLQCLFWIRLIIC